MSLRRRMLYRLEPWSGYPLLALARMLAWLPRSWGLAIGRSLASLAYLVAGRRATQVLEVRFPGRGRAIARAWFRHTGMSVCEFLRSRHRPDDHFGVTVQGLEHLPSGGAVLLCGHFGNLELMGPVVSRLRRNVAVVVNEVDAPFYHVAYSTHRLYGLRTVSSLLGDVRIMARAFRQTYQLLRDEYLVAFFVDPPVDEGLTLPFLGSPRIFAAGADALLARTGKPAVAVFLTRTRTGHLLEIHPLPATGATQAFVDLLSERVRARPEQYMWRW